MLHELVEAVHVDINEELRGEVAERQPRACFPRIKTGNDMANESKNTFVRYARYKDAHEDILIDRGKEFPYVALQNPTGTRVIAGDFICKGTKPIHCLMRPFSLPARIRIRNKRSIEEWI